MNKYTALLLPLFLVFISCKSVNDVSVADIDPALQPYYDRFIQEALSRNQNIAQYPKNFSIRFGLANGAVGRTFYETNKILIDSLQWKNTSTFDREFVIFHEIGHLFLKRAHDISTLPNREFKSMMLTYENNLMPTNTHLYLGIRRKYYVDELFESNTPAPNWSKPNYDPVPLSSSNRKLVATQEFDYTVSLANYLKELLNAQCGFYEKGLLNVQIPKGFGFSIENLKVMELAEMPKNEADRIQQLTNYEVEISYRLKKGAFKYSYSNNKKYALVISQRNAPMSCSLFSELFKFDFINYKTNAYPAFNVVRLIRTGGFFSIYLNNQHLFTSDVWNTELPNQLNFSTSGDDLGAEFDLDYYRIYERL